MLMASVRYFQYSLSQNDDDLATFKTNENQRVRQSFNPGYKLRFTGKVFMRATFPVELVEGKIPGLPADSIHWVGSFDPEGSCFIVFFEI